MARLEDEFDRMMKSFFDTFTTSFEGSWLPALDIAESNGNLKIKAEIPGVKKENLKINISNNALLLPPSYFEQFTKPNGRYWT